MKGKKENEKLLSSQMRQGGEEGDQMRQGEEEGEKYIHAQPRPRFQLRKTCTETRRQSWTRKGMDLQFPRKFTFGESLLSYLNKRVLSTNNVSCEAMPLDPL